MHKNCLQMKWGAVGKLHPRVVLGDLMAHVKRPLSLWCSFPNVTLSDVRERSNTANSCTSSRTHFQYSNSRKKDNILYVRSKWQRNCVRSFCINSIQLDEERKIGVPFSAYGIRRNSTAPDNKNSLKRENIFTVPNLLSLSRLGLAPGIGYLILHSEYKLALILLGVAGVTDLLDGFIARHFKNQSSVFGSMLDPVADKFLMSVLTVTLTWVNLLPVQLCLLIIGRDVGLISAVAYLRYKTLPAPLTLSRFFDFNMPTVQMKPTKISKYNTMLQLGLVGLCVASPVFGFMDSYWLHAYWYVVGATTILSGLSYVANKDTFKEL